MSVINEKFLPASLSEILASLDELRSAIDACTLEIQQFDLSELSTEIDTLNMKLASEIDAVNLRIDSLEGSETDSDTSDLSNRVEQIENVTEEFFDV